MAMQTGVDSFEISGDQGERVMFGYGFRDLSFPGPVTLGQLQGIIRDRVQSRVTQDDFCKSLFRYFNELWLESLDD